MTNPTCKFLIALVVLASPVLWGQATESSIKKQTADSWGAPDAGIDAGWRC